jgi:hypothetical protein
LRVDGEDQAVVAAAVAEALHRQHRRQDIGGRAAVRLGHRQSLQAEAGAGAPAVAGEFAGAIALDQPFVQLPAEVNGGLAVGQLFVRPGKVHA